MFGIFDSMQAYAALQNQMRIGLYAQYLPQSYKDPIDEIWERRDSAQDKRNEQRARTWEIARKIGAFEKAREI